MDVCSCFVVYVWSCVVMKLWNDGVVELCSYVLVGVLRG